MTEYWGLSEYTSQRTARIKLDSALLNGLFNMRNAGEPVSKVPANIRRDHQCGNSQCKPKRRGAGQAARLRVEPGRVRNAEQKIYHGVFGQQPEAERDT